MGQCRFDGVAEANDFRRGRRQAEFLDQLGLVELDLRFEEAVVFERLVGGDGFDIEIKIFMARS